MGWARYPVIRSLGRRINVWKSALENAYLMRVPGVIHVGANVGQERDLYRQLGLRVLWIEPIDEVFNTLVSNIEGYRSQDFAKHSIRRFAHRPGVGNYFDVVWKRTGSHRRQPWR